MRKPIRPWILGRRLKPAVVTLQVVPIPGVGAMVAGARNPHSGLLGRGIAQASLVVFGSYPLLIPGAIGLGWAIWDAVRIGKFAMEAGPLSEPTEDADPSTVAPSREERLADRAEMKAAKQAQRDAKRQERLAAKQKAEEDDETRVLP